MTTRETDIQLYFDQSDTSETSKRLYKARIEYYYQWAENHGETEPESREAVLRYKKYMEDKENGYKPTTANTYLTAITGFFNYMAKHGKMEDIGKIKPVPDTREYKRDALRTSDIYKLTHSENLRGLPETNRLAILRDKSILTSMAFCGLRVNEIVNLNIEDIKPLGTMAELRILGKGMTAKVQTVVCCPTVLKAIEEYLQARGLDWHDYTGNKTETPLYISTAMANKGERLTTRTVSKICKESYKGIGIVSDTIVAHSLRHSTATMSIEAENSITETQHLMRHKSPLTTSGYIHLANKGKAEASIEDLINRAKPIEIELTPQRYIG